MKKDDFAPVDQNEKNIFIFFRPFAIPPKSFFFSFRPFAPLASTKSLDPNLLDRDRRQTKNETVAEIRDRIDRASKLTLGLLHSLLSAPVVSALQEVQRNILVSKDKKKVGRSSDMFRQDLQNYVSRTHRKSRGNGAPPLRKNSS